MKRYYYRDRQADGDQKVFDEGFRCGYGKGYRAGRKAKGGYIPPWWEAEQRLGLHQFQEQNKGQTRLEVHPQPQIKEHSPWECTAGNCPYAIGSGPWGMSPEGMERMREIHDKYHK